MEKWRLAPHILNHLRLSLRSYLRNKGEMCVPLSYPSLSSCIYFLWMFHFPRLTSHLLYNKAI